MIRGELDTADLKWIVVEACGVRQLWIVAVLRIVIDYDVGEVTLGWAWAMIKLLVAVLADLLLRCSTAAH